MGDLFLSIIEKIKNHSDKFIDNKLLLDKSWFFVKDESKKEKVIFIFRNNGVLLISKNGEVSKAKWEIIDHAMNSILIESENTGTLFNIIVLTFDYLLLQKDGTNIYEFFVKQERYGYLSDFKEMDLLNRVFDDIKSEYNNKNVNHVNIPNKEVEDKIKKEIKTFSSQSQTKLIKINNKRQDDIIKTDNNLLIFNNPITWYISDEIKNNLLGVELIGLSRYQNRLKKDDLIIKSKETNIIEQITLENWLNLNNKESYIVLIDTKNININEK